MGKNHCNLASQDFWDKGYEGVRLSLPAKNDSTRKFINDFYQGSEGTVLEIGCFPGRYLAVFGQLGFILNGIDLTPQVNVLKDWFESLYFKVGDFYQCDFAEFRPKEKYDVVISFGFIEHFTDWEEQIERHIALVGDRGSIMITTPNFRGTVQNFLHRYFDRENYRRHFIPSMDPLAWAHILELHGFEIIYAGYFGKFDFWTDYKNKGSILGKTKRVCMYAVRKFLSVAFYFFPSDNEAYSPYCGVVARRK